MSPQRAGPLSLAEGDPTIKSGVPSCCISGGPNPAPVQLASPMEIIAANPMAATLRNLCELINISIDPWVRKVSLGTLR